jgi:hypothetical protein
VERKTDEGRNNVKGRKNVKEERKTDEGRKNVKDRKKQVKGENG